MDVLSQRILALQLAKRKGCSWEKAETVELTDDSNRDLTLLRQGWRQSGFAPASG